MNKVYVIADTHFGHKRVLEFVPHHRPFANIEEHDRELVRRWNSIVKPKDTVWHLGDVYFTQNGHTPLAQLNGIKHLVMGNHDHFPMHIYQRYFNKILGAADYKNCLLTHIPVHESQKDRWVKNIHGHLHCFHVPDPWYVCVSCEHIGLAPIPMDIVIG